MVDATVRCDISKRTWWLSTVNSVKLKSERRQREVVEDGFGRKNCIVEKKKRLVPGRTGRQTGYIQTVGFQVGTGSFPKLKIPHQSHADFCSTDTAGGLDNKKRRYAPRRGVAYRLFLWGFPKGAKPPFGTRLCLQSIVCYTLCRRCRETAVAAGEGKGV